MLHSSFSSVCEYPARSCIELIMLKLTSWLAAFAGVSNVLAQSSTTASANSADGISSVATVTPAATVGTALVNGTQTTYSVCGL